MVAFPTRFIILGELSLPERRSLLSPQPSSKPRRRGGQPGNTNALKHGFYSRRFSPTDLKDLEDCDSPGLQDEITLLRIFIRRLVDIAYDAPTIENFIDTSRILILGISSLNRMVKTQKLVFGNLSQLDSALTQALREIGEAIMNPEPGQDPLSMEPFLKPDVKD